MWSLILEPFCQRVCDDVLHTLRHFNSGGSQATGMVELEKGADMSMARDKDRDGDMDNNAMRIGACVPPQACSPASSAEALQSTALDRLTAAGPRERRAVESRGTGAIFRRAATTDPTTTPKTIPVLMADSSDYSYEADYSYVYSYEELKRGPVPSRAPRHTPTPAPLPHSSRPAHRFPALCPFDLVLPSDSDGGIGRGREGAEIDSASRLKQFVHTDQDAQEDDEDEDITQAVRQLQQARDPPSDKKNTLKEDDEPLQRMDGPRARHARDARSPLVEAGSGFPHPSARGQGCSSGSGGGSSKTPIAEPTAMYARKRWKVVHFVETPRRDGSVAMTLRLKRKRALSEGE